MLAARESQPRPASNEVVTLLTVIARRRAETGEPKLTTMRPKLAMRGRMLAMSVLATES